MFFWYVYLKSRCKYVFLIFYFVVQQYQAFTILIEQSLISPHMQENRIILVAKNQERVRIQTYIIISSTCHCTIKAI